MRRLARSLGYDLVRRHYYSPVPDLDLVPADGWTSASKLCGVAFDVRAGLRFLHQELNQFIAEYRPARTKTANPREFYLENGFYESFDAETLYAMVRLLRPRRVIELGSGFSSLVIADGRERNDCSSDPSGHQIYDPHPRGDMLALLHEFAAFEQLAATQIPLERFTVLEAGDVLFVDTTHTVKFGGDVNRIVLDVLPLLARGVYVHFHDIFLPWEYPKEFVLERRFYWAEQYLLQAFLAFNAEFEVVFGTHALKRAYPDAITELVPSASQARWPSAFWLRRG